MAETVEQFLERGGQITKCPPAPYQKPSKHYKIKDLGPVPQFVVMKRKIK